VPSSGAAVAAGPSLVQVEKQIKGLEAKIEGLDAKLDQILAIIKGEA